MTEGDGTQEAGEVDLYALPPEAFTAARDAAAKQARSGGDRAAAKVIAALRRPTVPAHLVNLLVRTEPELVDQLLELGPQLAAAQRAGQGEALRGLGDQRRALVGAVTGRAVELAGREVTAAVRGEVEATLEAALADPGAAQAVRTGRLVRALAFAGFGGADLEGAVAPAASAPPGRPQAAATPGEGVAAPPSRRGARAAPPGPPLREVRRAERAAQEAAGRLDDAVQACERLRRLADAAEQASEAAGRVVVEAERALRLAKADRDRAEDAAAAAREESEQAQERVRHAQAEAEAARVALDQLRRG